MNPANRRSKPNDISKASGLQFVTVAATKPSKLPQIDEDREESLEHSTLYNIIRTQQTLSVPNMINDPISTPSQSSLPDINTQEEAFPLLDAENLSNSARAALESFNFAFSYSDNVNKPKPRRPRKQPNPQPIIQLPMPRPKAKSVSKVPPERRRNRVKKVNLPTPQPEGPQESKPGGSHSLPSTELKEYIQSF
ncbi:unnamed protein product [Caenorhabditis auriculariae]|uniref:Uncharacterized protein n=1 Tax=Caenorhabditis auriculariae TaxID=2777116 RepID=A0A8S1H3G3_9PELO|nr:unnamed protein product [Caenorhabditis auriculariae]